MTETVYTALIVEDEPLLRAALRSHLTELWPALDVEREAADGIEAARMIGEHLPDVVFLDIHMPGLNGLEIARLVSGRCHVVFVTAFEEHAVAAFEEGALDFVVKPIDRDRLAVTVARLRQRITSAPADLGEALRRIDKNNQPDRIKWIQASVGSRIRIVPVEEVVFFQSEAKYTKVVTSRGDLHIRRSIKELAEGLDADAFWQIHRGTIVNAKLIDSVIRNGENMELSLVKRSERLAVSLPYQHRFRRH
ncbi:MAG: response regulator [Betaproteobacteria bacterium]|nr:response regulator [Betaproteobacteria bacterium]